MEVMTMINEEHGPEKQVYNVKEFREYMSFDDLSSLPTALENYFVFCRSQEHNDHLPPPAPPLNSSSSSTWQVAMTIEQAAIRERMTQWLQHLTWFTYGADSTLVQFWEPEIKNGGRCFLTTSQQPFALKTLYKGLSWYRKHCMNHEILVEEGADNEGLGPVGRVFLNEQPESSPDLRFYSIKEYPLRDQALRCGLRKYVALPVFESQSNRCRGVLELVSSDILPLVCLEFSRDDFKVFNLRLVHMNDSSDTQTQGQKVALSEIRQMFKVVNETPNIPLALAWVPCQGCSRNCDCMERALFAYDPEWNAQHNLIENDFLQACRFHKLQQGKGVAGRALSSTHKSCFCRSVHGFNIAEYPLAHYARKAMLTISFAICLQCAHTGSDLYVLEFFMRPGDHEEADPRSLIHSLLMRMKQQLLSFKIASGQKWGDELLIEILRFPMDDEPVYFQKSPVHRYPLGFIVSTLEPPTEAEQRSPSDRSHAQPPLEIEGGDVDSSIQAGKTSTAIKKEGEVEEITASFERERKVSSFQISYQELKSHFGKPQKEAANILGVSVSKFKRACRSHNITRWPSHIRNKANHSLFEVNKRNEPGQDEGSSRASDPSTCSITMQDSKIVTVKANYQSKTVKFQLCTSSGIAKLEEQVAKRLKLKTGDFEMSYEDEDGIPILLTCDEDLWFYTKSLTASTTIQLAINPT